MAFDKILRSLRWSFATIPHSIDIPDMSLGLCSRRIFASNVSKFRIAANYCRDREDSTRYFWAFSIRAPSRNWRSIDAIWRHRRHRSHHPVQVQVVVCIWMQFRPRSGTSSCSPCDYGMSTCITSISIVLHFCSKLYNGPIR